MKHTILFSLITALFFTVQAQSPDSLQTEPVDSLAMLLTEIQQLRLTVDSLQSDTTATVEAETDKIGPK